MGDSLDPKRDAAIYSLQIASNYGMFTFHLPYVLRWLEGYLEARGNHIRQWQFCKLNLLLVVVSMIVLFVALVGGMHVIGKS